ncbi:MAG: hypothetical protein Q8L05_06880 [Actinomycetota bacterium]|nr:hypothetical protein [Actinomycetota bacterium]MDP2288890.1 hypothetical protein [Actinomycetota bacterium]
MSSAVGMRRRRGLVRSGWSRWLDSPTRSGYEQLSYALPGFSQDVTDGIARDFELKNPMVEYLLTACAAP